MKTVDEEARRFRRDDFRREPRVRARGRQNLPRHEARRGRAIEDKLALRDAR